MARCFGQGRALFQRAANCARSTLTGPTRKGRSSKARPFTTRRRQGTRETLNVQTLNAQRPIRKALFAVGDLLHQRVETRMAAKIVEQRISREEEQVAFVASCEAMLERFYGAILFAQRCVSEGEGVLRNLCGLRHFIQAREKFSRFIRLSISGITLADHGHGIRIMVQLDRFLKFRDRLFESSL